MPDYTIQEIDPLQLDADDWESTDPGNITLAHQATAVADSEANWEREHKCLRITVSGDQSGDKVRLPVASFVDGAPSIVANAWFGFWIRASLTGASVVKGIMSSDGVEEEVTPNIATASKWQFVVADLSDLTGTMDYLELEILATESVTIEVSRCWYCNESRQLSGSGEPGANVSDEVIELTGTWYAATARTYTNGLVLGNVDVYFGYVTGTPTFEGCYFYGQGVVGEPTGGLQKAFVLSASATNNKFTGTTAPWIENATRLELRAYASGHSITDTNLYGCTNGIHFYRNNWPNLDEVSDINIYGSAYGVYGEYCLGAIQNVKIVGGTTGIRSTAGGCFKVKNSTISATNPPATDDIYIYVSTVDWLVDGATLGFDTSNITIYSTSRRHGIYIYRIANFVTSPVTQDVVVIGYSTKNSTLPTYLPFTGKPFARKGITDVNGIVQLYCLYQHYYTTTGSEVYSDGTDKYHFKFINGDEVQATHDGDISSGIGSEGSEQSITLTPAAVAGKRMVGQDMIFS